MRRLDVLGNALELPAPQQSPLRPHKTAEALPEHLRPVVETRQIFGVLENPAGQFPILGNVAHESSGLGRGLREFDVPIENHWTVISESTARMSFPVLFDATRTPTSTGSDMVTLTVVPTCVQLVPLALT